MRKKLLCALLAVSMVVSSGTMLPNTQAVTASAASTSVSPFTGKTYTHSDVFQGKNVYHGIDVSYHNGAIDWRKPLQMVWNTPLSGLATAAGDLAQL